MWVGPCRLSVTGVRQGRRVPSTDILDGDRRFHLEWYVPNPNPSSSTRSRATNRFKISNRNQKESEGVRRSHTSCVEKKNFWYSLSRCMLLLLLIALIYCYVYKSVSESIYRIKDYYQSHQSMECIIGCLPRISLGYVSSSLFPI